MWTCFAACWKAAKAQVESDAFQAIDLNDFLSPCRVRRQVLKNVHHVNDLIYSEGEFLRFSGPAPERVPANAEKGKLHRFAR
jgi:hypothetical protein